MSVRKTNPASPGRWVAVGVVCLLIFVGAIYFLKTSHGESAGSSRAFFTIDDGKTWFVDSASRIPPFEKDGKEAVVAHVYQCSDGTKFVNDLQRFKPDVKLILESAASSNTRHGPSAAVVRSAYEGGQQVKRPGDENWIQFDDRSAAGKILAVKCPHGGSDAVQILP